ncbi:IMPACT family protein [Collinsella bouchesdurhonensis]|uniref:IMPACT family protein n=1 Tax=Collinsella bouchesdurhonensis TaxID=1907654 RepID=UPI00058C63BB|nr:YigZ family protein [Collinsella bouchesdurhonensis]
MESYFTLRSGVEATGEFTDRKSRFIAQLVHIESEEEANEFIAAVRARHYDARHNVPAWVCADGRERQSDDGEPSRTSGMPTLEVLRGEGLKDVCCVTTRYFGGTLLGPGGLVRAYTAAAQAAVAAAREAGMIGAYTAAAQAAVAAAREAGMIVEMTSVTPVDVSLDYAQYEQVLHIAEGSGAAVASTDFTDRVVLHLIFRTGEESPFCTKMRELMAGREEISVAPAHFAEFTRP